MNDEEKKLLRECDISTYRSGGPGGQHQNKVETSVRVVHRPTGIVVTATNSRSQWQNKCLAVKKLVGKLAELSMVRKERIPTIQSDSTLRRRLDEKKRLSEKKASRAKPGED